MSFSMSLPLGEGKWPTLLQRAIDFPDAITAMGNTASFLHLLEFWLCTGHTVHAFLISILFSLYICAWKNGLYSSPLLQMSSCLLSWPLMILKLSMLVWMRLY